MTLCAADKRINQKGEENEYYTCYSGAIPLQSEADLLFDHNKPKEKKALDNKYGSK